MDKPALTSHPIHDLIKRRWSPRAFDGRPLSPEQIATLLEAGRWAPSCFNEQPWRFIVASRAHEAQFARAVSCVLEGNAGWAKNAALLIFTVAKSTFTRNDKPNRHAFHDVGLAVENIVLQATADGLGCHQMAGIDAARVREVYGVPDGYEVVACVAIGAVLEPDSLPEKLEERERAERSRKSIQEIAFGDRWGEAFGA